MFNRSWLAKSGQIWKLYILCVFLLITLALFGLFIASVNDAEIVPSIGDVGQSVLFVLFMVGGLGSLLWLVYSIRCPQCGKKVAWSAIRDSKASAWLVALLSMTACPGCGDEG